MKIFKTVLCMLLVLLLVGSLCACSNSVGNDRNALENQLYIFVNARAAKDRADSTIGGNKLVSNSVTITNIEEIADGHYRVSGKIVMTDVYGTDWKNTFDVEAVRDGKSFTVGMLEYTNKNWTRD